MAVNLNETRALRIMELIRDFHTLQVHIQTHVTGEDAQPPNPESRRLLGYVLLQQCVTEARRLLQIQPPANIRPGQVPMNDATRIQLQTSIIDASGRRFQAHRTYLRTAAAIRWVHARTELSKQQPNGNHAQALRVIDQTLQRDYAAVTDQHVFNALRALDLGHGYWVVDDPTLDQILAWIRINSPR